MKGKQISRVVAIVLAALLLMSVIPMTAFASIANWSENNVVFSGNSFGTNGYYNVISKKDYTLVPGAATETEMVLNNASGTRRQVMHIIELDPSNPDVSVLPGYYNIDKLAANPADSSAYDAAGVTSVAAYYENPLGYQVVGAMNTDLDYSDNAPRVLVYNGQILSGYAKASAPQSVLYVWNNGGEISCEVTSYSKAAMEAGVADGTLLHAISVSFAMVVRDGQLVTKTEERTSESAARSLVGVKEDGTLVLVMNDGRNANNSKGFCTYELGESMLALGCKWAANCDGGGSSSFVTRRAGEDDLVCRCVPCDGAERPTKSSVIVVSNVAPTGIFDKADITAEYDYFAPNTTYTFGATALDTHGYAMDMPADATWALSDDSFGTIANGTFVSSGKLGTVEIQVKMDETVVGTKEIFIANPTTLGFTQASSVLPYGKSTTLAFNSFIGEAQVYLDGSSFDFSLSNPDAGTLNGLVFTATTDESIADTVVTAKYLATDTDYEYSIVFGKGSEIVWDFEDGNLHGFLGQQDAYDWQLAHGVETPFGYNGDGLNTLIGRGQISTCVSSTAFIANEENGGKVHNGENALGFTFDMTQVDFNEWTYNVIYNISNVNGDVVLRDVANGKKATAFGCWVYVPYGFYTVENKGSLALQANLFGGATKASAAQIGLNMQYNGKNLNALTENDIPENRWVYAVANISAYNYVSLVDPLQMNYRSPSIMRMYVKPSVAQKLTYYFDDFTLDYSSAVDDRVPPVISNPQYAPADSNLAFNDGVVITEPAAAFTAYVSDNNSGIDASSAKITVDGKAYTTKLAGNMMYCDAVSLGAGSHKVVFEIADNLGNPTTLTRTIVSNTTDSAMAQRIRIEVAGHNDSGEAPMPASVYYIDVIKTAGAFDTAQFTLSLNTANTWVLERMTVADGYDVTYTVNPTYPNQVTFTCTAKSASADSEVIATIPVDVYNPLLTNGTSDGDAVVISGKTFVAPLTVESQSFNIDGTYGNYDKLTVDSIVGKRTIVRHEHTATAVEDAAPTCTEAGYTGRTYCDVCGSVVDWGTQVPATGHNYVLNNGVFACSACDAEYDYSGVTGLFEVGGKTYYAIAGTLIKGWQQIEDDWYYFNPATYTGVATLNNGYVEFEFDETGKLLSGKWYNDANGTKYYYGPAFYKGTPSADTWVTIDGNRYCFDRNGYIFKNYHYVNTPNSPIYRWYDFGNDGVLVGEWDYTGTYSLGDNLYYIENGVSRHGMFMMDGYYYYAGSGNYYAALKNTSYNCTDTHKLLPIGVYTFGPDGRMLDHAFYTENNILSYYILGQKSPASEAVEINGELAAVDANGKVLYTGNFTDITGEERYYVDGVVTYIPKNGVIDDYYYIDDVRVGAYYGLVESDGYFYYVNDGGKIVKNMRKYVNKTNDLTFADGTPVPKDYFDFDEEGRMVVLNGVVGDRVYINGTLTPAYYGLVEFDGYFYYVNDGGRIVKNMRKYVNKTNDLTFADGTAVPRDYFEFDEDGKMIVLNGIVDDYAYINGSKMSAYYGLVEFGGYFYYVNDGGKIVKNMRKYVNKTNDLTFANGTAVPRDYFEFDEDGKMIVLNGIVDDYAYINGAKMGSYYGLVEFDGYFYYVNDGGKIVKNVRKFVNKTNDLTFANGTDVPRAYFEFDADGKMIVD